MRIIALCLALFHGINGLVMLSVPDRWYAAVPGVILTGPFNGHFVRDTGLGFLAAAAALLLFAKNGERQMLWPAVVFLGGHAALHLLDMVAQGVIDQAVMRDLLAVVIPGLLPIYLMASGHRRPVTS